MKSAQNQPAERHLLVGWLLGVLGVIIFAGTLPATTLALESFSPWFITFFRALLASAAAFTILRLLGRRFPRQSARSLLTAGLMLTVGFPGLMALAMQTVPASHGGVVLGILPLLTAIFSVLLTHERPGALFWLCSIIGALLVVRFSVGAEFHLSSGDLWLFLAGICAALGYVISGKLSAQMAGWEVICWILVLMTPLSLLGSIIYWEAAFLQPQTTALYALLYLALFSMLIGFFAWNAGMAMAGIAQVSQIQLLQPFFTIAIAWLVLDETLDLRTLGFAAAVILVVWLGKRAR